MNICLACVAAAAVLIATVVLEELRAKICLEATLHLKVVFFGRIDACYTSIEAQKSTGSLHAHSQVFVQCLHQHTSLRDILNILRHDGTDIVQSY